MAEMTITPLDPLVPELTDEQKAAADAIMQRLAEHPGKRFLVSGFPGGVPDLDRLAAWISRFFDLSQARIATSRTGDSFEIKLEKGGRDA